MKIQVVGIFLLCSAALLCAQTTESNSESCSKNVSFAIAEGGQPVPAIPKFAAKWLSGKSRKEQRFSKICFSQIPSANLLNYVVIFSTSEASFNGLTPQAHTYTSTAPTHDSSTPVSSFGGTWSYAYIGTAPPASTDTLSLKRDDKPKSLDVRAYTQSGKVLAHLNLSSVGSRDKLLEQILTDIVNDSPGAVAQKQAPAPLSVYYVNCDVDAPPVNPATAASSAAGLTPAKAAAAPAAPPPPPELEIWSSPAGADIFVDGLYV